MGAEKRSKKIRLSDVDVENEMDSMLSGSSMIVTEGEPEVEMPKPKEGLKQYDQYGTMISKIHEQQHQDMNLFSILYSFSFKELYDHLSGTRSKKWDDRELDAIDGGKVWSFFLTSIANTTFYIFYINTNNIFQVFAITRNFIGTIFISTNLGLEGFIFFSVFLTSYRCFQIMDAKKAVLGPKDILKIYVRKFIRLAPPYYILWMIQWAI